MLCFREYPSFQMQRTNATLFTRVNLCAREYPLSKCKVQIRHYLLDLFFALENTPLSPIKMQSTDATLFTGVIVYFRKCTRSFQIQRANLTLFNGVFNWDGKALYCKRI